MEIHNYDELSMPCLLIMLTKFNKLYPLNKKPVIAAITKKYFEDKTSVNLYDLILNKMRIQNKEEQLNYILYVLGKELENSATDLPLEYRNDFFKVLIYFLTTVENLAKENNESVEWRLSNIPKLLDYLVDIDKVDIESYPLRQKINDLVDKIRKEFEETKSKNEEKKNENNLIPILNSISLQETEEKLNKIKTLKLQKSKLNKTNLNSALTSFELYSERDKCYLVEYIYKHKWFDTVSTINDVVAFDFFRNHLNYSFMNNDYFNPFRVLIKSFNYLFHNYSETRLNRWKEYFKVENLDAMIEEVRKWYFTFDNATEKGWKCYRNALFNKYFEDSHTFVEDENELFEYARKILLEDCCKYLSYFDRYDSVNIKEWVQEVETLEVTMMDTPPILKLKESFENSNLSYSIIESFKSNKESKPLILYYWDIFSKYEGKLFDYHGGFIEDSKIIFAKVIQDRDIQDTIKRFITVLNTVNFNGSDLVLLKDSINWNRYRESWTNKMSLQKAINRLINRYFCQNSKSITKDFIRDLTWNPETFSAFKFFMSNYKAYSGLFRDISDYSSFFFKMLKDDLNFSKIEDLKYFYQLDCSVFPKSPLFKEFYDKFSLECPDCYNIINGFVNRETEGFEGDILEFIKQYYNI